MSVLIEFRRDDRKVTDWNADDDVYLLLNTAFTVPVRMQIDGREILSNTGVATERWIVDSSGATSPGEPVDETGWLRQPLIGFLSGLETALAAVPERGSARQGLAFGGEVTYQLAADGQALRVVGPDGAEATVAIAEASRAVHSVRDAARNWLESARPELRLHPMWDTWFPERSKT